jgi:transcriptional regulator with XRE-family HTH domain
MGRGPEGRIVRRAGGAPPVDPALLARPDLRAALASHDLGAVFRVLSANGWSQRDIARAVEMHQSEVSAIVKGRQVTNYRVLARIADGLGIPRELMNLVPADASAYPGGGTSTDSTEEADAEMRRRELLAAAGAAFPSQPVRERGKWAKVPAPAPIPLLSRIFGVHVVKVRDLTQKLRDSGRAYGSDPQVSSATAAWATQLLDIPGAEPVKQALMVAVADLHILAGWEAFDASLNDRAMYHYTRGLELATEAGNPYLQAEALMYAGAAAEEHGHPNDGLKMLQFAHVIAARIPVDDQREGFGGPGSRAALQSCTLAYSANALEHMGHPDGADADHAEAREIWQPTPADPCGDLDVAAARREFERGRLDAAEPLAVASLRRWETGSQRARTMSGILLATIHVQAGEPDGLELAHGAITGVLRLSSLRARQWLDPLATALESRPRADHRELARMASQVATTRA